MAEPVATDSRNLIQLAVDVHTDLNKLTVGLQQAGANPQALQSLQQMSEIVGELVKVLGSGPVGGGPGQPGAGPQGAPPEQGGPGAAPGGPPSPAQQATAAVAPHPGNAASGAGFHQATADMAAALASKHAAAQKALAGGS